MALELIIEDTRWSNLDPMASQAALVTLEHLGLAPEAWDIALLATDDARIAALNGTFRQKSVATNVLSWPSMERGAAMPGASPAPPAGDSELGDIAIAFETCRREADEAGISFDHHVTHLIVHGVLHLLGYDHQEDADADLMESLETAILCKLGVPDPYKGNGQTGLDS